MMRMTESTAKPNSNTLTNILIHTMRNKTRTHIHDTHTLTGSHAELFACPPTKQQHGSRAFCSSAEVLKLSPFEIVPWQPDVHAFKSSKNKKPNFLQTAFQ